MSPITEIIVQLLWIVLAVWFIYRAYSANRKADPFSWKSMLDPDKSFEGFDDMFIAGGFVIGIGLIILLGYKLLICGVLCGVLLP